jgi:branched-chain amino acid transport system substrate-binding protein
MAAVLTLTLAACGGGSRADDESGDGSSNETGPIVVGMAIAKTGFLAAFDAPAVKAFKLAVEQINADGGIDGRQVEIVEADTQSKPEQVRSAGESVLDKGADVMITSVDYDFAGPAAQAAQQAGKLAISLGASSVKFGVQGIGPLAFTTGLASYSEGAVLANIAQQKGWDNAFVLKDPSLSYSDETCQGFRAQWDKAGGATAGDATFMNSDESVSSQVAEIQKANPGFIALCSYPPGGASAVRQIRAAGIDVPIVAGVTFDSASWLDSVPGLSDFYVAAVISVHGDDPSPEVNDFSAAYEKKYGELPTNGGQAANGFVAAQLIKTGVESARSTDGLKVAKALEKENSTLYGPATYTSTIHIVGDTTRRVLQFQDGKPKYLDDVEVGPGVDLRLN